MTTPFHQFGMHNFFFSRKKKKKYAFNKSLTLKKDSQNVTFEKGRFLHLYINFKQNAYVIYVHCLQESGKVNFRQIVSNSYVAFFAISALKLF